MAYSPFPVNYQPAQFYYPQTQNQNLQSQSVQQNNGIIWVQGEAGAKSYLVAPNTTVQLWDSESDVIYLKSADASGMPSIKIIDYTIRDSESMRNIKTEQQINYATKEEVNVLQNEINELKKVLRKEHKKHE